jgi:hypothetical protein
MPEWREHVFKELTNRLLYALERQISSEAFLFAYDPSLEQVSLKESDRLCKLLIGKGFTAEVISLEDLVSDVIEWLGLSLGSMEKLWQLETEDSESFLSLWTGQVQRSLSQRLLNVLAPKPSTHCAVLVRVGCLYPYLHPSDLINSLRGQLCCRLLLLYPGEKRENGLSFLGQGLHHYYPASVF